MTGRGDATAVRAILFDKDGTLVDFATTWLPAYRRAAALAEARLGRAGLADRLLNQGTPPEEYDRIDPNSPLAWATISAIAGIWAQLAGHRGDQSVTAWLAETIEAEALSAVNPVTDLAGLFGHLRGLDYVLGVATMDSEQAARTTLTQLGCADHVAFVCGADSGHGMKPDPGMVHAFCAAAGVAPAAVAMVGDTPTDLRMARAAGAGAAVGVLTGTATRADLGMLADLVVDSVQALAQIPRAPWNGRL